MKNEAELGGLPRVQRAILENAARYVKPGGVLLHVSPDEEHLWELKQAVYERPYRNDAAVPQQEGLSA